jgi:4-amino-4-deoxy-L-arabinose transferase-like glycosyltransferase
VELTHAPARDRVRVLTRRLPAPVLLGGLVIAIVALNLWWLELESRPPHWDMAHHLGNSLQYLHAFSLVHPVPFFLGYLYYPPLTYWVADAFYAATGSKATSVAILSNVVWLAVLAFSTFAIGRRLWNARVGWLSVAFVLTAPMIVSASKEYMLDVPVTAMAGLCLYLLIRSDGFGSRRFSLLFGVAAGLGMLVKWTLPLVLLLPVVQASAVALADARQRHSFGRMLNIAVAALLTLGICGPWYAKNLIKSIGFATQYAGPEGVAQGNPPVRSLESATWYFWNLLDVQLYLLPFLFVLAGLAFCFVRRELAARNLYPLLTVVGTLVMFSLLRHKDPRYTLPMLPALAVVATSWLEYVSARARSVIAGVLVVYGVAAFFVISFGAPFLPKEAAVELPSTHGALPGRLVAFGQHGYIIGPPTNEDWHQADAVRFVTTAPRDEQKFTYAGPDTTWFNGFGLAYYAMRYDVTLESLGPAHFLIYRGPLPTTPPGYAERRRWTLPDGTKLVAYEQRGA